MAKNFKLIAAFLLALISPIPGQDADQSREERERLIDLVLKLETDFGQTLRDYRVLQQDYAKLLARPQIPDQRGRVEKLQKQLDEAAKKIREHQRLEAETRKGMKTQDAEMAALRQKVAGDLATLRASLKEEQSALAVAQVKLNQLKELEERSQRLEKMLRDETIERSTLLGQFQVLRGEKNALLARVDELMKRTNVAEAAQEKSAQRIGQLEEQAGAIKTQIANRDAEIKRLKEEQAKGGSMMATLEKTMSEQAKLNKLLVSRETELGKLRAELAAEKKRALDVPMLIKARDDLEGKLAASALEQKRIAEERKRLTFELVKSNAALDKAQEQKADLEARLNKATELVAGAEKMGKQNAELTAQRDDLTKKLDLAVKEMMAVRKDKEAIEAEIKKNAGLVAAAKRAEQTNKRLLSERDGLQKQLTQSIADLAKARDEAKVMQADLKKASEMEARAAKLGRENQELITRRDALSKEAAVSKATLASLQKKVESLQADLTKNKEAVMMANKSVKDQQALVEKLEKAKRDFQGSQILLKEMNTKVSESMTLAAAATELGAERDQLQKALAETKTQLAQAELESKDAAAIAEEAQLLKKEFATVSARVETLEQDKKRLSGEVARKNADLKKVQAEMAAKPDESAMLSKLESEKKKLNAELEAKNADLKKVRMDLGRLHLSNASMEKQLDQLRRRMATIDPIRYAKGEADVREQQTRVLTQVKEVLMIFPEARFEIVGHTCDLGSKEGNLKLSRERSKALLDFLVSKGIPAERLKSLGMGDSQPSVPNKDEASRRQNRRVEVHILD